MKTKSDIKEILRPINKYLVNVDNEIEKKLRTGIPLVDESALHLFINGGKKIRASILILTNGLNGKIKDDIVELAAAAEIVHAATLVHDDIIDQALLRRGGLTVSKKFGDKVAVLAGDYMYTVALQSAVIHGNPDLFTLLVQGTRDMVKGELLQLQYSNIDSISEKHYFDIITLKTAQFMGTCAKIGALEGNFNSDEADTVYEIGSNIGYAFQIIDDTLDIIDESGVTGKDVGNDFRDGKVTLPFLYLLENGSQDNSSIIREYIQKPDEERWEYIRKLLIENGAVDYCLARAKEYNNRALQLIGQFPENEYRQILTDLCGFLINRHY